MPISSPASFEGGFSFFPFFFFLERKRTKKKVANGHKSKGIEEEKTERKLLFMKMKHSEVLKEIGFLLLLADEETAKIVLYFLRRKLRSASLDLMDD